MFDFGMRIYQFVWMIQSHHEQRLAWKDAADARIARRLAEEKAAAQLDAMLRAHPSGGLGHARLNDRKALEDGGLL